MRNKIIHALLTLAITLTCLISTPLSLTTRAANADGSIIKTATVCSGEGDWHDAVKGTCSGQWVYDASIPAGTLKCSVCDKFTAHTTDRYKCAAQVEYYPNYTSTSLQYKECGKLCVDAIICSICGNVFDAGDYYLESGHSHEYTMRAEYYDPCEHGYSSEHSYNTAYGYNGASSTFKVWPITIVGKNGLAGTVSVSGATATDAAISGKTVTIRVSGITAGTKIKITNSGTGTTNTYTASSTTYAYTFTMPAKATTITIELGQLEQAITATLSATSVGYGGTSTLSTSGAKTTLSYNSSNPAVATISSSGVITIKGIGTTTITINAAETTDYKSASKTVTLTVVKGNLSTKIAPTASLINYGQSLSSSTLSGGSVTNSSGSAVEGSWTWSPTSSTIPKVGATQFAARFTPTDTPNYNY